MDQDFDPDPGPSWRSDLGRPRDVRGLQNWISRSSSNNRRENDRNRPNSHSDRKRSMPMHTLIDRLNKFGQQTDDTTQRASNDHSRGRGRPTRGGQRGNTRQSHFDNRKMGFKTLEEIARADTKDVLQKIYEKRQGFLDIADSPIERNDVFVLLIEILSKISQSPFIEMKSKLILDVCNSSFISHLRNYLMDLPFVDNKTKNSLYWNNQTEFWRNLIIFCADIVEISPSTAFRTCRVLIESITKSCLEYLNQNHGFVLQEELTLKLREVRDKVTSFGTNNQPEWKRNKLEDAQNAQPPENFRELSVVPNRDDLLGAKPFLRPNIIEGGYVDVEHYLDVQFRLLREDCFGPIREGINQFLEDSSKKKYDHVRIFHNVKFVCPYVSNMKVGVLVQIDMNTNKNFRRINWAHSKRFIFGSLLLFSKDNCKTFIAATILDRDVNLLSVGKLPVSIIGEMDDSIYNNDTYTMIESEVYFEPYFHVLKALQDPTFPEHLAMQQYIVKVNPGLKHPAYLTPDTEICLRMNKSQTSTEEHPIIKFKVLQQETWPTRQVLGLNESQYKAYQLALTHEFSVIQGPPGTGKTYIAIKVAKTLLKTLKTSNNECLMMIICYTNHALDQFLEAISKITKSIVRIGSQSRNKAMDTFNLTNLRRAELSPSLVPSHSFFIDQRITMRNLIGELQEALIHLDILNNGVVSYRCLLEHVPQVLLLDNYYKNMGISVEDPLNYWLFEKCLEYATDFKTCLEDYETFNKLEEDIDITRAEMILDDINDKESQDRQHKLETLKDTKASFSLPAAKLKVIQLVGKYKETKNFEEKQNLRRDIIVINSRINLFNDMVTNRDRNVRFILNERTNFSAITLPNRWILYFTWVRRVIENAKEEVARLQASVLPSVTAYEEARMMMDVQLLQNKGVKVIGLTTSGAARMRKLLQAVAPKIVIVEEAAEVLEQHVISALTRDCQHLILIGDHQQLRPSASHMKLAKQYNIEVSLFERMITNGIHSQRLNVQHRMRPEIAALISPHIYPDLANHPTVEIYPNMLGIEKNLYFFTHDYHEEESNDTNSKANHKEADMTLALANYLMQQGYAAEDVTILAAYSGQMFYMRKERRNYAYLSEVKITVVDNYQGEESKIILLSLVRNNSANKIGFLGTENRICVALSRAKQGFYIFGNINMLKAKSELWKKIAVTLENNGSLGSNLILKCQNHPEQKTTISCPEDFSKLPPEGGCFEKCNYQYHCGHRCLLYCHGYDREHIKSKCTVKCERVLCDLGHVCPLKCNEDCEPCKVYVMKTLPCGHDMNVYCHREPDDPKNQCTTVVEVTLPDCGHKATKSCYMDVKDVQCPEKCLYRLEACGHVCVRKCHVNHDPEHEKYVCTKPCARAKAGCTAELVGDRGDHQCPKSCYETCDNCHVQVIKRRDNCKHLERMACCTDINTIPCKKKCSRTIPSCGHFCKKKCYETCGDCKEMVTKKIPECNHEVKVECMNTVSRKLCTEKCTRTLRCGHQCTERCGIVCDEALCIQPTTEVKAPCGHLVKLPCNISALYAKGEVQAAELVSCCSAACGAQLACGHVCAGTCRACHQGRLHKPCTQICNQDNICSHPCQEPCNQICPPCKMLCEVKCPHSHCKRVCCEPCVPCQEKCSRRCVHSACTRRCGEECSRASCSEPCALTLACGHACRGLCGEPCPDVCRICRPDEFPMDYINLSDYDDDAKFILLQDCGHVFEVEFMDKIMFGEQETIKIPACLLCRKPIINTFRYKDAVNNLFKKEINPIKRKVYGTPNQINAKSKEFVMKLDSFASKYEESIEDFKALDTIFTKFSMFVQCQKKTSLLQLEMQCIYLNIFEMLAECWQKFRKQSSTILLDEFKKNMRMLLNVLTINNKKKASIAIKLSQQQQKDVGNEIKRLNVITQFSKLLDISNPMKNDPNVKKQIESAKAAVFTLSVFDEDLALTSLKALQQTIKSSGLITKYERELIVKAIDLKAGHWYKCPNGHFYCIGECGGAMQVGRCADCGASIGGERHTLLSDNAHAPEMDGSRFSAWSEQNNLANFNLNIL